MKEINYNIHFQAQGGLILKKYPRISALIPARSQSKGVRDKNIKLLGQHPLLSWSIKTAKKSRLIDHVVVSTDSKRYAKIAKDYEADVPFLRPAEISADLSTDVEFLQHFLEFLEDKNLLLPNYLVILRPTTPFREPKVVDQAIKIFKKSKTATSLRSVNVAPIIPEKCIRFDKNNFYSPIFGNNHLIGVPRQLCKPAYMFNSYVDIINIDLFNKNNGIYGHKPLAFVTKKGVEIDTIEDFREAEKLVLSR